MRRLMLMSHSAHPEDVLPIMAAMRRRPPKGFYLSNDNLAVAAVPARREAQPKVTLSLSRLARKVPAVTAEAGKNDIRNNGNNI